MANTIHPSAVISDEAVLGDGNTIGPNVVIGERARIGNFNTIGVGTLIQNNTQIGDYNTLKAYASVGLEGEMGTKGDRLADDALIQIGSHNTIREFVTIHAPVRRSATTIGDHCYIMARAHVAHDCELSNHVVLATNSILGGGVRVGRKAYVGLGSITHQWLDIGEFSMIGMNAVNTVHVLPFSTVVGIPSKTIGFNKVGAERNELGREIAEAIELGFESILNSEKEFTNKICQSITRFVEEHDGFKPRLK